MTKEIAIREDELKGYLTYLDMLREGGLFHDPLNWLQRRFLELTRKEAKQILSYWRKYNDPNIKG